MKKLLALLLALSLCLTPVLAAENVPALGETVPADTQVTVTTLPQPSAWTLPYMADAQALKLLDDNYGAGFTAPVTPAQIAAMAGQVYTKLALLNPSATAAPALAVPGSTRGDVVNALGAAVNAAGLDTAQAVPALRKLGVLQGDGTSLALDRVCTYEEAVVMATRLVLAAYDSKNAGSKGLLWKATKGENTLYLLGTIHTERGNLYPFHQTLRNALRSADTVVLELDLQDEAGMVEFAALQSYPADDCLKNHIPEALYARAVNACAALGLTEAQTNTFKPWALANTFTSLLAGDDTAGDSPLAMDVYVNAVAAYESKTVTGAESYALQGGIFDTLSEEYQAAYLESNLALFEAAVHPDREAGSAQAALAEQEKQLTALMDAWQRGSSADFVALYDKAAIINSGDELNARLFTDRDPALLQVARRYLDQEGSHTTFLALGAGHMLVPGGIIMELVAMGYTVAQVTDYRAVPPTPSVTPAEPPAPTTITMSFAGDTMLAAYPDYTAAANFNGYLATRTPDYFLGGVQGVFANDDFTVMDLENVLSDRYLKPVTKTEDPAYWYRGPAGNANILAAGSVEVVSLSNNHTEDYGEEGLADTKAAVEAVGIQWGNRDRTVYLEKDGYKIAVICGGLWNDGYHLEILKNRLAEAELYSDFQVVFFHGGEMRVHKADAYKVTAAHALVDAGADLVVGSHPHCLQPRETYKGVDIVYSLGNFCYGGSSKPENATVIYRLKLTVEQGVVTAKTGEIIPCYVYTGTRNNFRPEIMADSPEKQAILDFMNGKRGSPV